jgi:hypothetical protein
MSFLGDVLSLSGASTSGGSSKSGGKSSGYGGGGFKFSPIDISVPDNLDSWTFNVGAPNLEQVTKPVEQAVETVTAPAVKAVEQVAKPVEQAVKSVTAPVVEKVVTPAVKAVEEVAKPVEQVAQTAVQAVTPVVESVVDVAKVPVQAVEQITKIDAPKVVESVVKETILAPVKAAETVVKAAEPVVQAVTQVVQQPVKAVEQIAKIDVPKVVENVVKQAATTVTEAPKMVVEIAENAVLKPTSNLAMDLTEKAKNALELTWENIISPFQPGTTEGTVAAEPAAANLDATEATGNEAVFEDMETATTKADKMTEEERLRRIRRLMLNRYGREDTILTGAKDPMNRRRYASAL